MSDAPLVRLKREGTVDQIADQLREGIRIGSFRPGEPLREATLADQLGVSRGPVREALRQLVQQGIAVNNFNRGVVVKELSDDDVRDVFVARGAIEKECAANLWRSRDAAVFGSLERIVQEMKLAAKRHCSWAELVDLDISFHQTLVDSHFSPRLAGMYGTLLIESRMAIAALDSAYPKRVELAHEHQVLIRALRGKDLLALYDEIDAHLDNTARIQNAARSARLLERTGE
ncbi:GntR family transcriptional regulator [Mycolicibacterium sp. 050158]|uniref:GntR family transcriptional regulator n=1 Tax=Mycobacteriaceae TaxID=1762 RepID=UPI00299EE2FD|nr:GntR family transcriptional regulator [Mycolicibacterium sp. 050158]MDX1888029.1 GntR family transcriptional regulator [Mycolicibacterium sp. 050158]